MKVLHLNYSDYKGGAARAVKRIHLSLLGKEIRSYLMVNLSKTFINKNNIIVPKNYIKKFINLFRAALGSRLGLWFRDSDFSIQSMSIIPSNFHKFLNKSDYDLINLHWVGGEMISIEDIAKITKPIVWTLHDMWPFCGAEHFTFDDRWKRGYYSNNQKSKNNNFFDLNKFVWQRKFKLWKKPMHIVGVSNWISRCAKDSKLMKNFPITTINNTLDTNFWAPDNQNKSRKYFNLPQKIKIFGYGSLGYKNSSLKGKDLFLSSIKNIKYNKEKFAIFVIGDANDFLEKLEGIKIFKIARIDNDQEMKKFYNAVDFIVLPSRLETFGQTASEAISCGKPVVCFDTTGLKDIVNHKFNGWLSEMFDVNKLAEGIDFFLGMSDSDYKKFSINSRKTALEKFSYEIISKKYINLYSEIIHSKKNKL
jgi:glycosyltransferase involved in cell wall biosynthesis